MEVTETNSILNMVMANRPSAPALSAGSGIGEDFAALLAQPRFAPESKDSALPKADAAARLPKASRQEKKVADNKAADTSRSERPARQEKPVSREKAEAVRDNKNPARNDNKTAAERNSPADNRGQAEMKTAETAEAGRREASVPAQSGEGAPVVEVTADGDVQASEAKVSDYAVSLEALAQLGNILWLNPQSGEWVQTTGAELAAQLAAAGETLPVTMPLNGRPDGNINILALDENGQPLTPADLAEKGMALEGFVPVEDGEDFNAALQAAARQTSEMPAAAEAAEQPEVLAKSFEAAAPAEEIIVDNKKIKLKVSVNEEKTAARSSSDLLADAAVVDQAVREVKTTDADNVVKGEPVKTANPEPAVNPAAANANPQVAANSASVVSGAAAVNPQAVGEAAAKIAAPSAVEVSAGHVSQAAVSGSEFVAAAKIEAANEDTKTSFKDIYKGMSREVVDQVKVNITKSAVKGIDKIDVRLKPEDLGSIEIKMQLSKDGKLQAHIISSRPETMEILQKEIQSLERAFNDAGFQTDEGSLSFSFRDDGSAPQEREQNNALRNFIGDVLSHEADNDLAADMYSLEAWNGKTGLNIRV